MGVDENHIELNETNVCYSYDITSNSSPAQTRYKIENGKKYHGIHVGGIIFANHNANRVAGISPGASLINISHDLKVKTIVNSWELGNAIILAVFQGARIINNSWGDQGGEIEELKSKYLEYAIDYAIDNNCVVVFAIGNKAPLMDYPATYRKEILTVGAISSNHTRASYSGYGDKLDVVAPGDNIYSTHNNNGYVNMNGTSMAAPHVSGVAALVLSVNSNLTGQQVRDIIESTAQELDGYSFQPASSNHPNGTWNNEVGYGLVDAYAAVQKALNYRNDLYIRDTVTDDGTMPSIEYSTWDSPDIWVETLDGDYVAHPHGNTKYAVCVKIHNRRDVASSGTERLFLNWAKAGFNDKWDEYWTSNNPLPCGAPKGGVIGSANGKVIPSIPANGYRIDTIHWITPAGEDYANCTDFNYNQWHFCLLARIHDDDTIAHEYEHDADVHQLVKNHNNVAQQNVYLDSAENYQQTLGVWNGTATATSRIICLSPKVIGNISITDYAEVYITLDAGLLNAINSSNISGLTWVNSNTLRWNGGSACIPVTLPANSYYTMMTTVHFLADQIPATNNFDFDIVLRNANGDSILGGEHYQCVRTNGRYFQAVAYDMTILWGETASLYATDILETAEYKWYDEQGNEVGDGLTCNVSPQQNTSYTQRVTADADGYRAYSTVTVMVVDGELRLLAPNPADNQVRIGYALSRNVSSATLQILNGSGQVVHSQVLNGGNGSKVTGETLVNTSSLAAGSYSVRLVSNRGNIYDSKTLVIR
ncbi:MAG: S8 family serine peptidase [Bacteroidales bacterium]|nr:S8 family serine peptidase [Bacteroidales bacterium]